MDHSGNQQHFPNPVPPSLSAGGFEKYDDYAAQDASRPTSQNEPYLTPYLGLRARLSQTWINRWTILLLLVLVRTLFAIATVDDNLGSARQQALSMCTSVENVGSAMASMPYYMSQGVNDLTASGMTKAVNGLMELLILTITGVEEIVIFILNMMYSTYLCLLTFAIGGSLHVAIAVAEDVGNFLNSTVQSVGKDLGDAAGDFQSAMNGFMSDLDKIGSIFTGKDPSPPTIDLSSEINSLNGLQLPSGYDQGLNQLNNSIPDFSQVKNFTDGLIATPFEEVKKLLNASLPKYHMNGSLFPVPEKQQLSFCSDNNGVNEFFDDLVHIERLAKKIFLIVIVIAAVLAMVPMAWQEIRRWKFMKERAVLIQSVAYDPMDAVYIVSRPYTAAAGIKMTSNLSSSRRKAAIRWSVAYATTMPALFVLSLALAGLLACLFQYILLKAMEKEIPIIENKIIGFADQVVYSLNNASEQWAVGANNIINDTNTKINEDVFGWVNVTTTAVNSTLNSFVDGVMDVLNVTFGGTVLYEPVLEVLNCLVLLKVQGIEKGLTWVSDHAYIDVPSLPNNTFSLGTASKVSNSSADILSTSNESGAADLMSEAVYHVIKLLAATIRQEAIISFCLLLVWVLIALMGIGRASYVFFKGGDHGTYPGPGPGDYQPSIGGRSEMDSVDGAYGMTNEKAVEAPVAGDVTSNKYQGQSYTLTPAPVPALNTANTVLPKTTLGYLPPNSNAAFGNRRNSGQAYTLTPHPMPTFEVTDATSPTMKSGFKPSSEKVGVVGGQHVDAAIRRPTHIRASSHGDYAVTSPIGPPTENPFLSADGARVPKSNPFSDPLR